MSTKIFAFGFFITTQLPHFSTDSLVFIVVVNRIFLFFLPMHRCLRCVLANLYFCRKRLFNCDSVLKQVEVNL